METRAGDPGAFAHFDLSRVDSPAFVVDAARLRQNLAMVEHHLLPRRDHLVSRHAHIGANIDRQILELA